MVLTPYVEIHNEGYVIMIYFVSYKYCMVWNISHVYSNPFCAAAVL